MSRTHTTNHEATRFAHHRLDVYHLALELLELVHEASKEIPRGYRSFADQLLRAAGATAALIGEGANRYTRGQKRQRFSEARGEAGEMAVHAEVLVTMGILSEATASAILTRADRVCAMLTALIKRHG